MGMTFSQIRPGMFLFRETVEAQFWTKIVSKTSSLIEYDSHVRWLYKPVVEYRTGKTVTMQRWNKSTEYFKSYVLIDEIHEQNFRELIAAIFTKEIEEKQ
jgi:hypothetical protein